MSSKGDEEGAVEGLISRCKNCPMQEKEVERLKRILNQIGSHIHDFDDRNCGQNRNYIPGFSYALLLQNIRSTLKEEDEGVKWARNEAKVDSNMEVEDLSNYTPAATLAICPEQKVLCNSTTLSAILRYLNGPDILNCRLVCKIWEKEVRTSMSCPHIQRSISVHFKWNGSKHLFQNLKGSFPEFQDFFNSSYNKFPFTHFSFTGGNLGSPEGFSFFSIYGCKISCLTLDLTVADMLSRAMGVAESHDHMSLSSLRLVLFKWIPNLQSLILKARYWPVDLTSSSLVPGILPILPHLHHLDLSGLDKNGAASSARNIVGEILRAAINLKEIVDPEIVFLDEYIATENLDKIKYLKFRSTSFEPSPNAVDRLSIFADKAEGEADRKRGIGRLRLLHITFDGVAIETMSFQWPTILRTLTKILRASLDTLERISCLQPLGFLPGVNCLSIPVLKSVKSLTVVGHVKTMGVRDLSQQILPESMNLGIIFPCLQELNIDLLRFNPSPLFPIFDLTNFIPTVTRLNISNNFELTSIHVKNLGLLCPNVRNLMIDMHGFSVFPEICTHVWNSFLLCETIEFKIQSSASRKVVLEKKSFCTEMDHAITGLLLPVCEELRERPETYRLDKSDLINFKDKSSVSDLKRLNSLTFKIIHSGDRINKPIFSHVSVQYGFQVMWDRAQKLDVTVKTNQAENSEIVEDFGGIVQSSLQFKSTVSA